MSDPVMCPGCGASFADYPPEGKCTQCGTTIPAPAPTAAPSPPPVRQDYGGIDGVEQRRGIPPWVTLGLLLVFVVGASVGTYMYMKKWGRERQETYVTDDLKKARKLAAEGKVGEAVKYLRTARIQAEKIDDADPMRARLLAKIEGERERLRANLKETFTRQVDEGDISGAEKLYASGVDAIDQTGALRAIIDKGIADRAAMRKYQTKMAEAKVLHKAAKYAEALKQISELRKVMESPEVATIRGIDRVAEEVATLQTEWVKVVLNRGYAELEEGKLEEAENWFRQAQAYVWASEQSLVRKLEDVIFQIQKRRVAGVYVNVKSVRMTSAENVGKELLKEVREKLVREDFLMVKLGRVGDPKGRQLKRLLMVDYREEAGPLLNVKPGKKVRSTKITCDLKLVIPGGDGELWSTSVYRETGPVGTAAEGGITEKTLRDNAAALFWRAFMSASLPRNLLFH